MIFILLMIFIYIIKMINIFQLAEFICSLLLSVNLLLFFKFDTIYWIIQYLLIYIFFRINKLSTVEPVIQGNDEYGGSRIIQTLDNQTKTFYGHNVIDKVN